MKKDFIDKIMLALVALLFAAVAFINIFQPERPTESAAEKRKLATMPEFSISSVLDGSYFNGFTKFISDTFVERDKLISYAGSFKTLYGVDGDLVVIGGDTEKKNDKVDIDIPDIPDDAIDTDSSVVIEAETTVTDDGVDTAPPVEKIVLSNEAVTLDVGGAAEITAEIVPAEAGSAAGIKWECNGSTVAQIAVSDGRLTVTALNAGSCKITASIGDVRAECIVKVNSPYQNESGNITEGADFTPSGLVIYKDAVYSRAYLSEGDAKAFLDVADYYAKLFPEAQISVCPPPLSTAILDLDAFGPGQIPDQDAMLNTIGSMASPNINFVNCMPEIVAHRDEYLYFKSDHHWTNRGAYYAYSAFAKSIGLTPTPLDNFEEIVLADTWQGSMYLYTQDERVALIYDSVYAYMPTHQNNMTVFGAGGATSYFDSCIIKEYANYISFIAGDNGYTKINVPDNPQDKNIIVLKDSFGNAFVPYLCEHFGNIYVVDPRYCEYNIYNLLKDQHITDVLFANNISSVNTSAWANMNLDVVTK